MGRYVSLTQVRQEIVAGSGETSDDDLIQDLIVRTEAGIDTFCRQRFDQRTETRYFDWQSNWRLELDRDLVSITTLTDNSDQTFTEGTHFYLYPLNGPPYRWIEIKTDEGQLFNWSATKQKCITVTGSWGHSTTVPDDVRHAAMRLAIYLYRQKDTGQFDTVAFMEGGTMVIPRGIPEDVYRWLKPLRKVLIA